VGWCFFSVKKKGIKDEACERRCVLKVINNPNYEDRKVYVAVWNVDLDTNGIIGVYDTFSKAKQAVDLYAEENGTYAVLNDENSNEEKKFYDLNYENKKSYETCEIKITTLNKIDVKNI
jgi:hypothetical protein